MRDLKKTKILHMIDTTGPAGAETVLLNIVEGLDKGKYKSFVILPDGGWLLRKLRQLPDVEFRVINGSGRMNIRFVYLLAKFVIENKIDIIHSHLFGSALYSSIVGMICRVPVICTFHGFIDTDTVNGLLKPKLYIIGLGVKRIVSVSNHLNDYMKKSFLMGREKCVTIYNGISQKVTERIERESARRSLGISEKGILVGSIGNINKAKGYDVLLRAASIVRKRYPNCFFLVAGETKGDYFNELLSERKRLGLEEVVHFIGFQEEVSTFLQIIDIFALPSNTEGFSLATIEAMNAGVPVVVTKSGGPQEIVVNNENGILVDVGDEIALANGIVRLIEDEVFREKLVLEARKTILERFLLSTMVEKYETLYSQVSRKD